MPQLAALRIASRGVQVARCLMCTRETFVVWQENKHLQWMRSCREVGDILAFLVTALDEEGLGGVDLTG